MMMQQMSRSLLVGLAVVVVLGLGALAQSVSLTVTAYSDAVRFSAQGAVKELRVEVLSLSGQKVFDSGPVLGNALDWKLSNTQGQPVANGVYLYTVTVKDPSGNVTKKLGKLAVLRGKGGAAPPLTLLLSGPTVGEVAQNPRLRPLDGPDFGIAPRSSEAGYGLTPPPLYSGWRSSRGISVLTPLRGRRELPGCGQWRDSGLLLQRGLGSATPANFFAMLSFKTGGVDTAKIGHKNDGTNDLYFVNFPGGTWTDRMVIKENGNVGIGTSSPSAKTHINNTANQPALRIDSSAGTNALEIYNTEGGQNLIFRVERATGNVYADGSFTGGGADVAERIDVTEAVEPGDVVEIDPDNPGKFRKAREALSTRVAGVISTAPGVVLGNKSAEHNDARPILALAGRVPVKATAKYGAIAVGDLLVSSPIPGYAMKCPDKTQCIGAVIGKALEPLAEGSGLIEVQVVLR
jgi:hypothetical protein